MFDDGLVDPHLAAALERVIDPELRRPITELGMVASASIEDARAAAVIRLTVVGCPASDRIERDVTAALESVVGRGNADVSLTVMTPEQRSALIERLRPTHANPFGPDTLTRVIMIASGKGGVGKSTITANLAVALAATGLRVGIVDADVYGFSIPGQLGITTQPTRVDSMMLPPVAFGVKTISIGMFVEQGTAVSWRGPMLHRTLKQFLTDVYFGDLDYLLLDLPPGTGDVAISAGQLLPTAEVYVVTTPQQAAADVAIRAGILAKQIGLRVGGVIENMSWLDHAGERIELFGSGGGSAVADALTATVGSPIPLVAQIPLSTQLREDADATTPAILAHPADPASRALAALAETISRRGRGLTERSLPISPR